MAETNIIAEPYNKFEKYKISRSLNGDKIIYLARSGKHQQVVGRADTEAELKAMMVEEAKKVKEAFQAEVAKLTEEKTEAPKKKLGLWKPGGALKKTSKTDSSTNESETKVDESDTVAGTEETL